MHCLQFEANTITDIVIYNTISARHPFREYRIVTVVKIDFPYAFVCPETSARHFGQYLLSKLFYLPSRCAVLFRWKQQVLWFTLHFIVLTYTGLASLGSLRANLHFNTFRGSAMWTFSFITIRTTDYCNPSIPTYRSAPISEEYRYNGRLGLWTKPCRRL